MSEKFPYVIFFCQKKDILEKEKQMFIPNFYENIIRLYIMEDLTDTFYFRIFTKEFHKGKVLRLQVLQIKIFCSQGYCSKSLKKIRNDCLLPQVFWTIFKNC